MSRKQIPYLADPAVTFARQHIADIHAECEQQRLIRIAKQAQEGQHWSWFDEFKAWLSSFVPRVSNWDDDLPHSDDWQQTPTRGYT